MYERRNSLSGEIKAYVEEKSRCARAPLSGLHFWATVGVVDGYWESYCFKCSSYARGMSKPLGQ